MKHMQNLVYKKKQKRKGEGKKKEYKGYLAVAVVNQ